MNVGDLGAGFAGSGDSISGNHMDSKTSNGLLFIEFIPFQYCP